MDWKRIKNFTKSGVLNSKNVTVLRVFDKDCINNFLDTYSPGYVKIQYNEFPLDYTMSSQLRGIECDSDVSNI